MKKLFCAISFLLASAFGHAAPPSSESIDLLLSVSKTESTIESMYNNMEQMMRQGMQQAMQQALKGQPASAAQQRVLETMPAKFTALMREEMSWAKLKPMYLQIYSETFEQADIDGLIAFYSSPTGQVFTNKMPTVLQKTMTMTQTQMQTMMPKMMSLMQQVAAEASQTK